MLQIIFSGLSAKELSRLPKKVQLAILDEFQVLPDDFRADGEKFGTLSRGGRKLYRFRCKDYRIYFEKNGDIINVRCILNKNSMQDFLYRTKVPINEDQLLEENPNFWKLVEGAPKK
jgi:mRNA-degrading endonuclease RelE of RelBE toxin-antitoxin system